MAMTLKEFRQDILLRAAQDSAFRAKLLSDPAQAVADAFGIPVPGHLSLLVMEETPDRLCLVLPALEADNNLTDEQMDAVTGGFSWGAVLGGLGTAFEHAMQQGSLTPEGDEG